MSIQCPACYSDAVTVKVTRTATTIFDCAQCGLQFAQTAKTAVIDTDPCFYHTIDQSYNEQLDRARKILPRRIVAYERLLGRPLTRVLEVGCATGAYAHAFEERGISYTGVEIESHVANKARLRTGQNIINANFLDFRSHQQFDLFFCSQVLEHVPDPQLFLAHAITMTVGGIVHIDVPNHDGLASSVRKLHHKRDYGFIQPPHHMIAYNSRALGELLKKSGLEIIHCRPFSNDDPVWGQLVISSSTLQRMTYSVANAFSAGSLLSAVCTVRAKTE